MDIAWNCMDHQSFDTRKWQRGSRETKTNKEVEGVSRKIFNTKGQKRKSHSRSRNKNSKESRDSFKGQLSPVFLLKTVKDLFFFSNKTT